MRYLLPAIISSSYIKNLIKINDSIQTNKKITFDWRNTKEIESSGYSILSVILDHAIEAGCQIDSVNFDTRLYKHPILNLKWPKARIGDREHFFENSRSLNMSIDGSFSPFFATRFAEKFHFLPEKLIFHGQMILNELLQNATDHSGSERYYLYAEVKQHKLIFGVLDSGISIPAKMAQKYVQPSDENYIDFSFKEGITTRRLRKGGYGLFHTFNIIKDYDGNLVILSRSGGIRRYFAQRKVVRLQLDNNLRGTWCFLEIKSKGIPE